MPQLPNPYISVIIPFLNPGIWLKEAIESVMNQSYDNWEIILIDDGSVEEDSKLAKTYSLKYPNKIFYLEHLGHINRGLTASRNFGISNSKGDYIAFLDADDFWLNNKLINQVHLFKVFPDVTMICEASKFWYSWNDKEAIDEHINIGTEPGVYSPCELSKKLYPLGVGQPPCPSGIIIKREAFNNCGGFEESFRGIYQLYEDQAFLAKVYLRENILISEVANNFYRKRVDSMSSAANELNLYKKVRAFFFSWFKKYIEDSNIKDKMIFELLINRINE